MVAPSYRARFALHRLRFADVLCPQTGHIPPSHLVDHLGSLGEGLRLCLRRYARVVYEYRFAPIVRKNEAVPTLTVVPALDGSCFLVQFQSPPLSFPWVLGVIEAQFRDRV
jgi:hypothetical protein